MVIWITGLSASGKTTLAKCFIEDMKKRKSHFALVDGDGKVTKKLADSALSRLGVDQLGLDSADRRYLSLLAEGFGGGPVGVETIAAALSESRDAIEEVIEPYLLQAALIQRSPRGRILGPTAWIHLGINPPKSSNQNDLFNEKNE